MKKLDRLVRTERLKSLRLFKALLFYVSALIAVFGSFYILDYLCPDDDCYLYVPEGTVEAQWRYTQFPMTECSFCTSRVNLNRHHIISQLAAPHLANEPTNIIVLCRSCHQVIGHKNNWKKFNPAVREICNKYGGPPVDSREWRENH